MVGVLAKLCVFTICGWFNSSPYEVFQISSKDFENTIIISELQKFEASFTYPFSNTEKFSIEHGKNGDYFAYFKHLGEPYYYVALCRENRTKEMVVDGKKVTIEQYLGDIAAAGCGVLRTVPAKFGKTVPAWYVCDLKVDSKYQGEHIPTLILQQVAAQRFYQCPRGYGICMNPRTGDPKAAAIFKKHGKIPGLQTKTLNLYTFSAERAQATLATLAKCLVAYGYAKSDEKFGFQSTSGLKDYIIFDDTKTNKHSWQLFHFQHGVNIQPLCDFAQYPVDGTYMVCAIEGTPLDCDFKDLFGVPTSTAQIVSYGMEDIDFNFLTSDQI